MRTRSSLLSKSLSVLLLVGFAPFGLGQNEGGVRLKFVSFPKGVEPVRLELQVGEGQSVEIKAPSNEISEAVQVPALSSWVFGETVSKEDGTAGFKSLGKGKSAGSSDQIVMLIKKGAKHSDGYAVLAVDGRTQGFGKGKMLFLNAAGVRIAGEVGQQKFALVPGGHSVIRPRGESGLCQAVLYYDKQGEARPFFSSRWPVSDEARAMIFVYQDPETKKLKLHSLREFVR